MNEGRQLFGAEAQMIWGKSHKQYQQDRTPRYWFAWRPVVLIDGRWAWLQNVWRYYYNDEGGNYAGDYSGFRYRERAP